ncbi:MULTISPECIES: baseplate J/gp47 family protein [unclassified Bradyrhizobium]|uniref:baseplate J/gp47 family protein n=1 Tax=unclassified Bradyrhizobium TaxID=2631580 RepID=UPI00291602F8|nr:MULTISPECIES: baseplate J/gp47 family protein [unclassified Bradyrhizobium]
MDLPLPNIPLPVIEREPTFETLFNNRLDQLRGLLTDVGFDWDTYMLRSDPLNRFCRHAAYGDLLMVSAMNDTFRATLTDFAQGADLIALASDWDLTRADGETIDDLRRRLRETKKGQGGFSDNWYKRFAFAADPLRVDDVGVEGDGSGGVLVSILSKDNGGVASDDLLATVEAALNAPGVRGDNDHIRVVRAVILTVNVEADVWLLPEASKDDTLAAAETALFANFATERRLGWDFASDFAIVALRTTGVKRVMLITPQANSVVVTAANEAVALGSIKLNYAGRAY